jgi:hypothetical protein
MLGKWLSVERLARLSYQVKKNNLVNSGLPKAEIFGRSRSFLLFGLRLWLPKFYFKYSAFGFVLKMGYYPFFSSLKADRLKGY